MMGNGMMTGMGSGMFLNAFFIILVIVGLVLLVMWAMRRSGSGGENADNESAMDILKKRYARGEVTGEEYEKMKQDIS